MTDLVGGFRYVKISLNIYMYALHHHHSCECLPRQYPPFVWKIEKDGHRASSLLHTLSHRFPELPYYDRLAHWKCTSKFFTLKSRHPQVLYRNTCTKFVKSHPIAPYFFLKLPPVFSITWLYSPKVCKSHPESPQLFDMPGCTRVTFTTDFSWGFLGWLLTGNFNNDKHFLSITTTFSP